MKRIILTLLLAISCHAQILSNVTAYWKFDEAQPGTYAQQGQYQDATNRGNTLVVYPNQVPMPGSTVFSMGADAAPSGLQPLDGSLAAWGKWNRTLTVVEKAALTGGETWPFSTTTSLQDAVAYYLLNESSNATVYADATGRGNTLGRVGTTTQVSGPIGIAHPITHGTEFVSAGHLFLSPAPTDLQTGNSDFTIFGWFLMNTKPSGGSTPQSVFWGQIDLSVSPVPVGAVVYYQGAGDYTAMDLGNGIDLYGNGVTFTPSSSPSVSTWYPVFAEYNATTSGQTVTFNRGTPSTFLHNIQPATVAGKINSAAQFMTNPLQTFTSSGWDASDAGPVTRGVAPNSPDVTIGNNSKTVWFWFKATDTSTTQTIAGNKQFAGGNNQMDWCVQIGSNALFFEMGNTSGTFQFVSVPFTDTTTFHLLVAWYDKTANTIHLDIDHGSLSASAVLSGFTPAASTLPLYIGASQDGNPPQAGQPGAAEQYMGIIDEMGIANGAATSGDLNTLWNGGAGVSLSQTIGSCCHHVP